MGQTKSRETVLGISEKERQLLKSATNLMRDNVGAIANEINEKFMRRCPKAVQYFAPHDAGKRCRNVRMELILHSIKMVTDLVKIVEHLQSPAMALQIIHQEAVRHRSYSIEPEVWELLRECTLATLTERDSCTSQEINAWDHVLKIIFDYISEFFDQGLKLKNK